MHIILGLDPGLAHTGFGVLQVTGNTLKYKHHGVIKTRPSEDHGARLLVLHEELKLLCEKFAPDQAAIEQLFFSRNVKSAMPVAEARGVTVLALAQANIRFSEYTPGRIKQAVTGNHRADKRQMISAVKLILGLKENPSPDHAADALAVAICHSNYSYVEKVIADASVKNRAANVE